MILYDANAPGPNPVTVRLFILERGGLEFDVETIDLANLANRRKAYRDTVNARGEVPALRLGDGEIITEITAICGYLDEVAAGGRRLDGATPQARARVRMWTRRAYLEICHPMVSWWRGTDAAENLYRGNRVLQPEAQRSHRLAAEVGLNHLDDDLEGRAFLCGDEISTADIVLYGFMGAMSFGVPWLNPPGRTNVAAWFERMAARPASQKMMQPLQARVLI
jgi:glutathione S-transferase